MDVWVALGTGTSFWYYSINAICSNLGEAKCRALPVFYSLTGCDTTSQFYGKGKNKAWEAWDVYQDATEAFSFMAGNTFQIIQQQSSIFATLERFVCVLYDKTGKRHSVNDLRQDIFSNTTHPMENLPPTQAALLQHCNRVHYQASIWTDCLRAEQIRPSPKGYGWRKDGESWKPAGHTTGNEVVQGIHQIWLQSSTIV